MPETKDSGYSTKRATNNAYWTDRALQYRSGLCATASTPWVRAAVLRRLRGFVKPRSSVLEVGCGNASSLLGPLSANHEVYGVDLNSEMLQLARNHRRVRGLVRSDACHIPFRHASFDFVYTSRCLINIQDAGMQRQALAEVFRVSKPNGTVILVENFEEPMTRMNLARERYDAGPQIKDEHNLLLNLQETLAYTKKLGWNAVSVRGNTLASFATHILFRRYTNWTPRPACQLPDTGACGQAGWSPWRRMRRQVVDWFIRPIYLLLTRLDDCLGARLPLLGKDVMVVFRRA